MKSTINWSKPAISVSNYSIKLVYKDTKRLTYWLPKRYSAVLWTLVCACVCVSNFKMNRIRYRGQLLWIRILSANKWKNKAWQSARKQFQVSRTNIRRKCTCDFQFTQMCNNFWPKLMSHRKDQIQIIIDYLFYICFSLLDLFLRFQGIICCNTTITQPQWTTSDVIFYQIELLKERTIGLSAYHTHTGSIFVTKRKTPYPTIRT